MISRVAIAVAALALSASIAAQPVVFVRSGIAFDCEMRDMAWSPAGGALVGRGALFAGKEFGAGDARAAATLRWTGGAVIGVGSGVLRLEGTSLDATGALFADADVADGLALREEGVDVSLTIVRRGDVLIVSLDDDVVAMAPSLPDGPLGAIALAAHGDAPLRVIDFAASGDLVDRRPRVTLWTNTGATTYRAPGLLATPRGTLLAYCEAHGAGRPSIVMRRSTDGGRTWEPSRTMVAEADADHANPCAVGSSVTDVLWVVTTRDDDLTHRVVTCYSDDDGATWSDPVDITAAAMRDEWERVAPVPGAGVEVMRKIEGRLVVPAQHVADGTLATHVLISDDFGESWELGGVGPSTEDAACAVIELDDGSLMLVTRFEERLLISTSDDDGQSWGAPEERPAASSDTARFSLIRQAFGDAVVPGRSVVASLEHLDPPSSLGLFTTRDEGETRSPRLTVHAGPAGASSLALLPDGSVAVVYESGVAGPREAIDIVRVAVEEIEGR